MVQARGSTSAFVEAAYQILPFESAAARRAAEKARPDPVSVKITNWQPIAGKETLRAFFSVELPSGLVIHKVSLHQRDTARWICAPSEKLESGEYRGLVEFATRDVANNFRRQVLFALQEQGLA